MKHIKLSVIVVTHNHGKYIERCLESLTSEIQKVNGEIIVIDNLSDDDSATLAQQNSKVTVLINSTRRGFSRNNNLGMALAKGKYILLLNPDTEVLPGALGQLVDFMERNPSVGLCGAQLLFPGGEIQPSPRRFPTLGAFLARRTPLRHFLNQSKFNRRHLMLDNTHTAESSVDWLLGACMLIRREVLDTVGPLDEGFFLYVEDIDWAKRIQQAHWEVRYVPTAQIIHHHLAVSDKKFFSRYMWLHFKSMVRYTRKHMLPPIWGIKITKNNTQMWHIAKMTPPHKIANIL